jgi:hypothetical protein
MAYTQDLENAARRHLQAAENLYAAAGPGAQPGCKAVSGYLFGLAGELAVKQIMRESGLRPLPTSQRRDDPFYAHFPELKRLLQDQAEGRRAAVLLRVAKSNDFREWDTNMRYAPTQDVKAPLVDAWRAEAQNFVDQMGVL